jgi:hypothetical protein
MSNEKALPLTPVLGRRPLWVIGLHDVVFAESG